MLKNIKKGDIVGRISYGKDIFFIVDRIISIGDNTEVAILKGLTIRIKADSPIEDLEVIRKEEIENTMSDLEQRIALRLSKLNQRNRKISIYGKVLHLDRGFALYAKIY